MVTSPALANTSATLHLLLLSPQQWPTRLPELAQLWRPDDQLLLMSAAVQGHAANVLLPFAKHQPIGLYQPDSQQTPLINPLPAHLQLVSSELWATWTLHYARCMTWR
ncbi:MAG: hypothetical protein WA154_00290 [Moraxellaceae bacterium]